MVRKFLPTRIPILYVILSVLVLISVVPMFFYSSQVQSINRDRLITNERLLQNTVTRSVADDISQHQESFRLMQTNLASVGVSHGLVFSATVRKFKLYHYRSGTYLDSRGCPSGVQ